MRHPALFNLCSIMQPSIPTLKSVSLEGTVSLTYFDGLKWLETIILVKGEDIFKPFITVIKHERIFLKEKISLEVIQCVSFRNQNEKFDFDSLKTGT